MAEPALPVWAREKEEKKLFAAAVGYEAPASVLSEKEMTEEFVNVKRGAGKSHSFYFNSPHVSLPSL